MVGERRGHGSTRVHTAALCAPLRTRLATAQVGSAPTLLPPTYVCGEDLLAAHAIRIRQADFIRDLACNLKAPSEAYPYSTYDAKHANEKLCEARCTLVYLDCERVEVELEKDTRCPLPVCDWPDVVCHAVLVRDER